ncbi:uncharacterized protein LOC141613400 [Silene latifolia]|uniref:uncharacterized protein LOC141613400 n=1 Tax=Silene latifolia TaxID=37657 RepID=UPI003D76C414
MSNLTKLDFAAFDISGSNYSEWVLDAEMYLKSYALGEAIKVGNTASEQNKAKAIIFLRRHLHEGLKYEYLTVKDPLILWKNLKERYDHLTTVILPKAKFDWIHLRLQDFKSIIEYNSAMHRIASQLTLCGEKIYDADMLEKTYQTFHSSQLLLSQQYRQRGFKKYSELVSYLLVAEQSNQILLKNHQSHPTSTDPFPEVNATVSGQFPIVNATNKYSGHTRGSGLGRGRGRGRNNFCGGRGGKFKRSYSHQKGEPKDRPHYKIKKTGENLCHRCGSTGYWINTCRTPQHLVDLYKQSQKNTKGKNIEANFAAEHENFETNYADGDNNLLFVSGKFMDLDISDFMTFDPNGEIGPLIGEGGVPKLD